MNCRKANSKLADLLLDPVSAPVELRDHVAGCAECRRELAELRSTMSVLDEWATPEANPFFDAKLLARIRTEQQAQPAGFLERWKAHFLYGSSLRMQPLMTGALAIVILAGGGTYANFSGHAPQQPQQSAAVRDLQSLDGNAQVFQQLDSVDDSGGQNQDSGTATSSSD